MTVATPPALAVSIDGQDVQARPGQTILELARELNLPPIPTLCYDPRLAPFGACRMCLVEVEGARGPVAACAARVTAGMRIATATPALRRITDGLLELLLSDHPSNCPGAMVSGYCELHDLARQRGLAGDAYPGATRPSTGIVSANPFIAVNLDSCILCARCVRMCDEVQGDHALDISGRGFPATVLTTYDRAPRDTDCVYCGQCVATCPTGALLDRKALRLP